MSSPPSNPAAAKSSRTTLGDEFEPPPRGRLYAIASWWAPVGVALVGVGWLGSALLPAMDARWDPRTWAGVVRAVAVGGPITFGLLLLVLSAYSGWRRRRLRRRRHAPWEVDGWRVGGVEHRPPIVTGSGWFGLLWRAVEEERAPRLRLSWSDFPLHPGDHATLRLSFLNPPRVGSLSVSLVLVAEHARWGGFAMVFKSRHVETFVVPAADVERGRAVDLTLDIPRDAPGTDLTARPALHWLIEVRPVRGGRTYAAFLPVPIYTRPEPDRRQRPVSFGLPGV